VTAACFSFVPEKQESKSRILPASTTKIRDREGADRVASKILSWRGDRASAISFATSRCSASVRGSIGVSRPVHPTLATVGCRSRVRVGSQRSSAPRIRCFTSGSAQQRRLRSSPGLVWRAHARTTGASLSPGLAMSVSRCPSDAETSAQRFQRRALGLPSRFFGFAPAYFRSASVVHPSTSAGGAWLCPTPPCLPSIGTCIASSRLTAAGGVRSTRCCRVFYEARR
jgi:hypothetical protein